MILTLTINPAIDHTITADRLVFEDRGYILSSRDSAGGRGLNASCVIHSFSGKTQAVAICGGKNGDRLESFLGACGFAVELVRVKKEIRTNLTITDRHGLTIKLNEIGPTLTARELRQLTAAVEKKLSSCSWLMLCGSVPPGVPPTYYRELIEMAKQYKVKTFLDTDGPALIEGVEAGPTMVAPNQPEGERLLNRALITRSHFLEAVDRIHEMGAEGVLLSLGSRGAVAANGKTRVEAVPPRIDVVSPIGSGDAMAAAFVWASDKGSSFEEATRWGVAAGTASAKLPGIQFASFEQTRQVYEQVETHRLR
ncbi:MAG: 1-phosphofructokinase family hexose kinase [Acidobacteria bacterium]|nr:1-phosphofructokinase family hexose kinase [Acidobacteriota bacterium]